DHTAVKRGMMLVAPGRFRTTRRIDVRLELISSAPKLKEKARAHFHSGTFETIAEIALHSSEPLRGGQSAFAHLRLQEPTLLLPGDRFIVRQFSPVVTIGGGVVLDNLARRPAKKDVGRIGFLETLEKSDKHEILRAMTSRSLFGLSLQEIAARTSW